MELLGTKYQYYVEDKLVIFRITKIKSEDKFSVIDQDGTTISMSKEQLKKCIKLEPDAILNIMATTGEEGIRDVYGCVNRCEDMKAGYSNPVLILRQNVYSSSKNSFGGVGNDIYVGECLTDVNRDSDETFTSLMEFNTIDYSMSVALYVDDKFSDISRYITGHNAKKFDEVLRSIKSETESNPMIKGYCNTLEELFKDNGFLAHYRNIFNIAQLDFPIELEDNVSEDGVIALNNKQIARLEKFIRSYITDVKVLKYDKDIDISKIVGNTHMMVSDSTDSIYLISYVVSGMFEVDPDIARVMSIKK